MDSDSIVLVNLTEAEEIKPVEDLQRLIWPGSEIDIVPMHLLLTAAQNGGLMIGAYYEEQLVGFVFGFVGIYDKENQGYLKHCSHMLGVHPDFRDSGMGTKLKRAQWQLVRQQGLDLITWTYDPLESRNAYLNIGKLGAICSTYKRNEYGDMADDLNIGVPSDRFQVDWWVNSRRVLTRLSEKTESRMSLAHYLDGGIPIINQTKLNKIGFPMPYQDDMNILEEVETRPNLVLFEIPGNIQEIKSADIEMAREWRLYTRVIFELFFNHGYLVTDFVFQPGDAPKGYYVLTHGEATIGF